MRRLCRWKTRVRWVLDMDDLMDSLMKKQTWDLVELSESKQVLHNKWVYWLKKENNGTKRYKLGWL